MNTFSLWRKVNQLLNTTFVRLMCSLDLEAISATLRLEGYEVIKKLGKGGFASVYLVKSIKYNQLFAAKVIKNTKKASRLVEIEALLKISGPNIIEMYKFFEDEEYLYIILEYCPGGSLKDYVKENGPIPEQQLYKTCSNLIIALKQCHDKNMAHRDIKPGNILIDAWGRPKLSDFGLSRFYPSKNVEENNFAGSRAFMCPNMLQKMSYNPFDADIWALGITFYFLAYGILPWNLDDEKAFELEIKLGMINFPFEPKYDPSFTYSIRRMIEVNTKKKATLEYLLQQNIFNPNKSIINSQNRIPTSVSLMKCTIEDIKEKLETNVSSITLKPQSTGMLQRGKTICDLITKPVVSKRTSFCQKRHISYLMNSISSDNKVPIIQPVQSLMSGVKL